VKETRVAIEHLKINGAELTYLGEGAGVPVVLLNITLGGYRGWQRQVDALSPQYRVKRFDRAGVDAA
jgi:pimeloyl-ACP methyl ester carboxylesterase